MGINTALAGLCPYLDSLITETSSFVLTARANPQLAKLQIPQKYSLHRRPSWLPFAWRNITPVFGLRTYTQKRDWQLVLDSRNISFIIYRFSGREYLYVPPLLENIARMELASFALENRTDRHKPKVWPVHDNCFLAILYLLPLIWLHGMQAGWWQPPALLPPPAEWHSLGCLDAVQVKIYGQWYRLITALTLHAGIAHIAGNVVFGAIFLTVLARIVGWGHAMLLTLLAGIGGNLASLFAHSLSYQSAGFSTALFGCIGIMGGIGFMREQRGFFAIAAALAILAMLGTEGEHTDYLAHICGLVSGLLLGTVENIFIARNWRTLPQWLAAGLAFAIPVAAWHAAFSAAR